MFALFDGSILAIGGSPRRRRRRQSVPLLERKGKAFVSCFTVLHVFYKDSFCSDRVFDFFVGSILCLGGRGRRRQSSHSVAFIEWKGKSFVTCSSINYDLFVVSDFGYTLICLLCSILLLDLFVSCKFFNLISFWSFDGYFSFLSLWGGSDGVIHFALLCGKKQEEESICSKHNHCRTGLCNSFFLSESKRSE